MKYAISYKDDFYNQDLIATEKIWQGETIEPLPSVTLDNPDVYSLEIMPGVHADCSASPIRAINHSCEPNSAVRDGKIVAWACINKGESITLDYKKTESKLHNPFDCVCGSKRCRGRIE